jgi:Helix-turn-helix domain
MTQKQRILERLKTGEWLSSVEAIREMYITRLGARIWDLRKEHYEIEERKVAGKGYSEYRLRPARKIELPPAYAPKAKLAQPLFNAIASHRS